MDVLQMLAKQVCLAAALLPIIDCCSQTGDFEEIRKGMETKVERAELLAMAHFLQQLIADSVKDAGLAAAVGSPSRGGQQQGGAGYGASHNQQQQGGHGPRAPGAQEQYWADAAGTVSDAPYLYTADTAEYVHDSSPPREHARSVSPPDLRAPMLNQQGVRGATVKMPSPQQRPGSSYAGTQRSSRAPARVRAPRSSPGCVVEQAINARNGRPNTAPADNSSLPPLD